MPLRADTDVGETDESQRRKLKNDKAKEGEGTARNANDTYDATTANGRNQGNYKGGGDPSPAAPNPTK